MDATSKVRGRVEGAVVVVCALAFAGMALGVVALLLTGNGVAGRDFVSYWIAGHTMLAHANPYDAVEVLRIERGVGFPESAQALIMRNAPYALPLVLPAGLVGLRVGSVLWTVALLGCLGLSVLALREIRGAAVPGKAKGGLYLLGCGFGPALASVLAGQTALFALLGLMGFLRWHRSRPFAAGVALWFCALKPHLFLPFGVVVVVWVVASGSYRVLAGAGVALAVSSAVATGLHPAVWRDYSAMMRSAGFASEYLPCVAVTLRFLIRPEAMWVEYVPAALACVWAGWYFWRRRAAWDWWQDGAVVVLVSVVAAPYCWMTDQAVVIPALAVAAFGAKRGQVAMLALASAVVELEVLSQVGEHSPWLLWAGPFWLGWFLVVRAKGEGKMWFRQRGTILEPGA